MLEVPKWLTWASGIAGALLTLIGLSKPAVKGAKVLKASAVKWVGRHKKAEQRHFELLSHIETIQSAITTGNGSTIGRTVSELKANVKNIDVRLMRAETVDQLQSLDNETPMGICDCECRNKNVNECYCTFTGKTKTNLLGYGWKENVHPDDLLAGQDEWWRALQERRPRIDMEMRIRHHSEGWVWMKVAMLHAVALDEYLFIMHRKERTRTIEPAD